MNLFRTPVWCAASQTWSRPLDQKYLRVCAVYRLLKRQRIGKTRALELLDQRKIPHARGLVDLWRSGPIKDMQP